MDAIERCAQQSILRALGFAALAIGTVMLGLSFEPALCFRAGATLCLLVAAVLAFKGLEAPRRNVRHTEVWLLLDGNSGLPPERLQQAIGGVLRRYYFRYAEIALGVAGLLWLLGLAFTALA